MEKMNCSSAERVFTLAETCDTAGKIMGILLISGSIISSFVIPGKYKLVVILPGVILGIMTVFLFTVLAAFLDAMGQLTASNVHIYNTLTERTNDNVKPDQKSNQMSASKSQTTPGSSLYKPKGL